MRIRAHLFGLFAAAISAACGEPDALCGEEEISALEACDGCAGEERCALVEDVFRCVSRAGAALGGSCAEMVCAEGACLANERCAAPCASREDCAPAERCEPAFARAESGLLEGAFCVPDLLASAEFERIEESSEVTLPLESGYFLVESCKANVSGLEGEAEFSFVENIGPNPLGRVVPVGALERRVLTLQLPSGDVVPGGESRLRFDAEACGEIFGIGPSGGSRLDLDFYLMDSDAAPGELDEALDGVRAALAPAGVTLGDVRVHAFSEEERAPFRFIDAEILEGQVSYPKLISLFRLHAGSETPSVPIFLVRNIEFAIARAGAIPGTTLRPGSVGAGVVVGLDSAIEADLGRTLAHELGHIFGLFHTSETDGSAIESFADTASCDDIDGDGQASPEECPDASQNLMFYSPQGETLSESQRALIGRSPLLR